MTKLIIGIVSLIICIVMGILLAVIPMSDEVLGELTFWLIFASCSSVFSIATCIFDKRTK